MRHGGRNGFGDPKNEIADKPPPRLFPGVDAFRRAGGSVGRATRPSEHCPPAARQGITRGRLLLLEQGVGGAPEGYTHENTMVIVITRGSISCKRVENRSLKSRVA